MRRPSTKIWRRFFWVAIIVACLAVMAVIGGVRYYYQTNLRALNNSQSSVSFTIPTGTVLRQTATKLQDEKIIKSGWAFERYVRNHSAENQIKAGTYELSPSYDVSQIVSIITEGKVATNLITILPGKRLDQIKKTFINAGFSSQGVDAAFNPDKYDNHPALVDKPKNASLEGYLYPESFQRTTDTSAEDIIRSSLDEMQKRLTPELRQAFSDQGLSVYRAVTLASIVEKEVSKPSDRAKVAQVFLLRLKQGRRLESDATTTYAKALGSVAYDTYAIDGLPPGPISNVTESSLNAVAHPAGTDWLYFVSGDDGNTYFSHTLDEHQALTAQHCKKLCSGD